jgi:hypothetical protein
LFECDITNLTFDHVKATDNCDAADSLTVDATYTYEGYPCTGDYRKVFTFSTVDASSNTVSATTTISIIDTTPPEFAGSLENDVTLECDSVSTPVTLTATDVCDGAAGFPVTVNFQENTQSLGCDGEYVSFRTWSASDVCGNEITHVATVTVGDNTPPGFDDLSVFDTLDTNCHQFDSVVFEANALVGVTATDNCSTAGVTVSHQYTPGSCTHRKTVVSTYVASDDCSSYTPQTKTTNIIDDDIPTIDCASVSDVSLEWNQDFDDVPIPTITSNDNCGTVSLNYSTTNSTLSCPNESRQVRVWQGEDECGNLSATSCTQTVLIVDTTPPVFTNTLVDQTIECDV